MTNSNNIREGETITLSMPFGCCCTESVACTDFYEKYPVISWRVLANFINIYAKLGQVLPAQMAKQFFPTKILARACSDTIVLEFIQVCRDAGIQRC